MTLTKGAGFIAFFYPEPDLPKLREVAMLAGPRFSSRNEAQTQLQQEMSDVVAHGLPVVPVIAQVDAHGRVVRYQKLQKMRVPNPDPSQGDVSVVAEGGSTYVDIRVKFDRNTGEAKVSRLDGKTPTAKTSMAKSTTRTRGPTRAELKAQRLAERAAREVPSEELASLASQALRFCNSLSHRTLGSKAARAAQRVAELSTAVLEAFNEQTRAVVGTTLVSEVWLRGKYEELMKLVQVDEVESGQTQRTGYSGFRPAQGVRVLSPYARTKKLDGVPRIGAYAPWYEKPEKPKRVAKPKKAKRTKKVSGQGDLFGVTTKTSSKVSTGLQSRFNRAAQEVMTLVDFQTPDEQEMIEVLASYAESNAIDEDATSTIEDILRDVRGRAEAAWVIESEAPVRKATSHIGVSAAKKPRRVRKEVVEAPPVDAGMSSFMAMLKAGMGAMTDDIRGREGL